MPAIPLITAGVSAYSAYKAAKSQSKAAGEQKALMNHQSALANEMSGFARNQYSSAQPAMQKAMQHYMQLATGNRAAISSAIAPERNAMTESYRGAERGMESQLAPGPARDRAIAELYRQRAGNLGVMPFQARNAAFGNLAQMGQQGVDNSLRAYSGAGSALTGASNTGVNYMNANNQAQQGYQNLIANVGKFGTSIYDIYRRRRAGGGGMPGMPGGSTEPF